MNTTEKLKNSRNLLLKLHKLLVDRERASIEMDEGQLTSGQFLNMLLNEPRLDWLRRYSTLIVEIDEMFDLDDGFSDEMVAAHLEKIRGLLNPNADDGELRLKYSLALQENSEVAGLHAELANLLDDKLKGT
ncbi:MAG: hypothetical protein WBD22_05530 [Pyrinomonadaceae bacterium]